jgi:hypothetical protein
LRDLSLGETGGPGFVLANARQLARTSDGRWLAITDIKQRVTGRASVVIRAGAVAPVEDADFQESMELAGNLGNSLLGDRLGSADQGSIAVDPDDVVHAAWRRSARNGKGELWYARCSLRDGDLADPASWHGPGGDGTAPSRLDQEGRGPASLGDIVVTAGGTICVAYSQGGLHERRVMLARPAAGDWHRTQMTERFDYGDPVLDVDESGTLHLAYGPDPRSYEDKICSIDFGEFEEEFVRDPAGTAERYGIYYCQCRDGATWTGADGRTPGAELVAYSSDHPTIVASRGTILIGYMARGNWPGMVDRVFYSSYRRPGAGHGSGEDGAGRWKMHVNLNRDESQEVGSPIAFVDRYGQPRLAWVNRDRHHVFMSRWMGGGMAASQGIRWAWELAPALSVEKRMPAGGGVFGLLYLTADGEIRFGRVEVPAIDPRRAGNVLFLDLWELAERRHVDLIVNTAKKDPRNPVLQGEPGSWDAQAICYGTVLQDEGRYRMWYTARSGTTDCAVCCYAVSDDGITWERPNLGLFEYHGSTDNNICALGEIPPQELPIRSGRPTPNPSVYKDEREPDPAKRYKMMLNSQYVHDVKLFCLLLYSPDGIHWTPADPHPEVTGRTPFMRAERGVVELMEANAFFYDELEPDSTRRWKVYGQAAGRTGPGGEVRVGVVAHSPDGEHWTVEWDRPVLDPRGGSYVGDHLLSVWPYREYYLGVPDVWPESRSCDDELTVSRDGYHFVRVADGQKLIARGEMGEWDAQFVSNANTLVTAGDQILIYYAGTRQPNLIGHPATHYVIEDATHGQTGLARVPVDGWTYLRVRADRSAGSVTTNPIAGSDLSGLDLTVKADHLRPGRDYLVAELIREPDGAVLPGFAAADCTPVDTDGDAAVVCWEGKRIGEAAAAAALRIRFHLMGDGARFYCFGFRPS